jgi:N-acetylmuramoyl-L-alanine amidase
MIVIDPGHNGRNAQHLEETTKLVDIGTGTKPCNSTGTASAGGFSEAELNWQVAVRTREALAALGAEVVLTRPNNDGWGPCITDRAAVGNRVEADAALSIHADGGPAEGRGFHVIHPASVPGLTDDIAAPSLQLARSLRASMAETAMPVADYVAVDGFSERSDLGGLNLSDIPAVFLEMGNMRNPEDAALLADAGFQQEVATAIARALEAFLER